MVKVKLLFFARARELAGRSEDFITIPEKITCVELLEIIVKERSLQEIQNSIILSINEQLYHTDDIVNLREGDEIAVIPPLSGG
ncbi:hypothetical protein ABEB36_002113 [Hypothenemus hampei]|uniref:Molybdopterin synthase sulfur carrier subunit n=1 Tax=Hypothenemus hampei TaxID=57062 RepID=A0ABD1F4K9_HYPHA